MEQIPEGVGRLTIHMFGGKAFEGRGTASSQSQRWTKARPVGERAGEPMRMELQGDSSRRGSLRGSRDQRDQEEP